ncbi:gamma-glutamyltransferase [Gracilibacillus sp. YIM 98692]|uniref:gamma-glutamyltransferase n=1 Tax=Gracilibacillus sp. YIM 98692 TaxID=2663532 RepID=UPI0013D67AC9|nr:gamma-glutamyltransferase [Gracilibacillus sp. YIM 98692]
MKAYRPTTMARKGAVTAPHYLASQAGLKILQEGGNAIHAAIAIASTLGVVYPHMNGIGGDNFWLIYNAKNQELKGLNASGKSGIAADRDFYLNKGYQSIPERGYLAVNTVPGAVSGWREAYEYAEKSMDQHMEWSKLLEDAIDYAENGYPITDSQIRMAKGFMKQNVENTENNDFTSIFIDPLKKGIRDGTLFYQRDLANTLKTIAEDKGKSFYQGEIAGKMTAESAKEGGMLRIEDFMSHRADWVEPISVNYRGYTAFNLPPNTQGIASLSILNILNQFDLTQIKNTDPLYYHLIVEATKLSFRDRDKWVTDQQFSNTPIRKLLSNEYGKIQASNIHLDNTRELSTQLDPKGDTVWFGVVDKWGNAVSMIQSIYHEYGAGVVPSGTGVLLQNRGCFFSLEKDHVNRLEPRKRTFHTLNPAMLFDKNRPCLIYGTMGGEGQPQTQAALVTRIIDYNYTVQEAIEAPRWLYGRTWGVSSNTLKVENRIPSKVRKALEINGHKVETVEAFSDVMGHAGAILINKNNVKFAGSDPRSDGSALGY